MQGSTVGVRATVENTSYTATRLYKSERSQAALTESQQAPVLAAFYLAYVRNPNGYGIVQSGMKISASTRLSEKLEQARADLAHVTAANLLAIEVDRQPPGQGIYGVHPDAFFDLIDGAGDASPS